MNSLQLKELLSSSNESQELSKQVLDNIKNDSKCVDSAIVKNLPSLSSREKTLLDEILARVVNDLFLKALSANDNDVDVFLHYHSYLQDAGRLKVREFICSFIEENESRPFNATLEAWEISDRLAPMFLFEKVSSVSFDRIFEPYGVWMSPIIRLWVYRCKKDEEILLDESIIDYWNKETSHDYYPFDIFSRITKVKDYVDQSPLACDKLRLIFFIETTERRFFDHISDSSILYTWLPKKEDELIKKFLLLSSLVPVDLFNNALQVIGAARIAKLLDSESCSSLYNCSCDMVCAYNIQLKVTETKCTTESSGSYGGYWTWGEGMKHQKCTFYTYRITKHTATVYTKQKQNSELARLLNNRKDEVKRMIQKMILEKCDYLSFHTEADGKNKIAILHISDVVNTHNIVLTYTELFTKELVNTETVTDD